MKVIDGWLCVPFDGSDWSRVQLRAGGDWMAAFFGFDGTQRVVKIRPTNTGSVRVSINVDGIITDLGRITI